MEGGAPLPVGSESAKGSGSLDATAKTPATYASVAESTAALPDRTQQPESKAKAKKDAKKAANKAIKQESKKEKPAKPPSTVQAPSAKAQNAPASSTVDPDSMFKVGFLADVYKERPAGSDGIEKIVTRCGWTARLIKR